MLFKRNSNWRQNLLKNQGYPTISKVLKIPQVFCQVQPINLPKTCNLGSSGMRTTSPLSVPDVILSAR
jgi:hypothetical protein